jgi:HAD superfamily hydrolase (TIGR01509 family)
LRYKLAIFDWNGTIPNDVHVAYASAVLTFRIFAPHVTPPTIEEYRNEGFRTLYYGRGIPESVTLEDMHKIWVPYYDQHLHEIELHDSAVELLIICRLMVMKNAMVSAAPEEAERHFAHFKIEHLFDMVTFNARQKEAALVETLDFFGVKAEDALYIDDMMEGLEDARRLGMATIGFTGGFNNKRRLLLAKPTHIVNSLKDVVALIK